MEGLKKCPFCGGEAECGKHIRRLEEIFGWVEEWVVVCHKCGVITKGFKTSEEAIQAWNEVE